LLAALSFAIDYKKTIQVPSGGTITVKQFDSNCKSIMNCGPSLGIHALLRDHQPQ